MAKGIATGIQNIAIEDVNKNNANRECVNSRCSRNVPIQYNRTKYAIPINRIRSLQYCI